MSSTDLMLYWEDRIERDLTSFGDPGGVVVVTRSGRSLDAVWIMRGAEHDATFTISSDGTVSVNRDTRRVSYHEFISGPEMANLLQVAQMINKATPRHLFVATRAQCDVLDGGKALPAIDVLTRLTEQENETGTRVVMVTGGAGAGKTRVLQEFVRRQAQAYLRGKTPVLALYVNAQGRALARLNEALATELQDLKVGLTYHSVAVLARLGILVPVIDGFDELLGISGYDDAFSSLAGFLEQLEGTGQLVASARSVYYEEEFVARADRTSVDGAPPWLHLPVRVRDWSDDDRHNYINEWAQTKALSERELAAFETKVQRILGEKNRALAQKPLFFTRVVAFLHDDENFSAGEDLLRALVRQYLARERSEKLLDREGRYLLTEDQLERLMSEMAVEMWNLETRELDTRTVREVAEYYVENEPLSDLARSVVVERMPTLAFLSQNEVATVKGVISFEHELFFFYFLAAAISAQLNAKDVDVRLILSRSPLSEDVADRIAGSLTTELRGDTVKLGLLLDRLSKAGRMEWRRSTQVRENAGLIAMSLFRECGVGENGEARIKNCDVRSMIFPGGHLRNVTICGSSLVDVTVRRTDLSMTRTYLKIV